MSPRCLLVEVGACSKIATVLLSINRQKQSASYVRVRAMLLLTASEPELLEVRGMLGYY